MRRPLVAAAITVAAAIGAGCGGGAAGDPPTSEGREFSVRASTTAITAESLTKPEFVERANDVCRNHWPSILRSFASYSGSLSRQMSRAQRFAKAVPGAFMASVDIDIFDRIREIVGAPPGEEEAVEEILGAMQEGVERGQRQVRVTSPAQLEALFKEYNRLAREYGLDECRITGPHLPHTPP